jgi:flavin reductase (DIM6/NTAB) family NADH-FMN oxidoreductase RutF
VGDSEQQFQRFVGGLDYPLFVVTAAGDEERDGCVVGFATQCSIHPPLFLVCLSNKNRTYRIAKQAEYLVVHDIPDDRRDLAELFGGETADEDPHKLDNVEWRAGPGGAPIVDGLPNWFAGQITERLDWSGDHTGFVLAPVAAQAGADGDELTFQEAKDIEPGHEP